jgi:hypothetical protein
MHSCHELTINTSTYRENIMQSVDSQRLKDLVLSGVQQGDSHDSHAFDTRTGRSYSLNPSARQTLQLAQAGHSQADIISQLAKNYAQPSTVITVGVEAFFQHLRRTLP